MKILQPWKSKPSSYLEINANAVLRSPEGYFLGQKAGVPFHDLADTFQPLPLAWEWRAAATLDLFVKIKYEIITPGTGGRFNDVSVGRYSFKESWSMYYEDSRLLLHPEAPTDLDPNSPWSGPFVVGVAPEQYESAAQAEVQTATVVLGVTAGYTTDGLGFGLSFPNGVGVSAEIGGSSKGWSRRHKLLVQCLVFPPKKKVAVPSGLLKGPTIYFDFEQWEPDGDGLRDLDAWAKELETKAPAPLLAAIRNGICPISLDGFASEPGNGKVNDDYAKARIRVVTDELEDRLGDRIRLKAKSYSDQAAYRKGASKAMQKVEIHIKPWHAEKAMTGTKTPID